MYVITTFVYIFVTDYYLESYIKLSMQLSGRNVGTIREAIEIIEETREAVGALEVELGIWDSDSVYDRIDSWLAGELKIK